MLHLYASIDVMYSDPEKWISKPVTLFERRSLTYQRFPSVITPGVDSSSTPFLQTILSVEINWGEKTNKYILMSRYDEI